MNFIQKLYDVYMNYIGIMYGQWKDQYRKVMNTWMDIREPSLTKPLLKITPCSEAVKKRIR